MELKEESKIILGVDPGLAETGWGIIKVEGKKEISLNFGVIKTGKDEFLAKRLETIHAKLKELINEYSPISLAAEDIFFAKNVKSAILVAQARGVILMTAGELGIPAFEYTPLQVKQALAGYGRAEKIQVQQMVATVLNLKEIPKPDHAADALAIALCHAHSLKRMDLFKNKEIPLLLTRSHSRRRKRF